MKFLKNLISSLLIATPFIGGACGDDPGSDPQSVYGPPTMCTADTDCVKVGEAWLADDAKSWICNIEDGASEGNCGPKK